jgi:hypothetical protein
MKISYGKWDELAAQRITEAALSLKPIRDKSYALRRLTGGDTSLVGGATAKQEVDTRSESMSEHFDFFVDDVVEGRSNRLLEAVKTLSMQVTHKFPEIEFEDLDPLQAAINAGACKYLLGPPPTGCSAQDHIKLATVTYLIDGIGWSELAFDAYTGQPVIRYANTHDVSWETGCDLVTNLWWCSIRKRETLGYWLQHFGTRKVGEFAKEFGDNISGADFDRIVELEFYHDIDGASGRGMHYVFRKTGRTTIDPKPIYKSENPWYFERGTKKQPFLPLTPLYYLRLPSMRNPISIVEMMLADQLSIWKDEDRWDAVVEHMKQFYAVRKGSLDAEAMQAFKDGEDAAIVEFSEDGAPPALVQAGEPPMGLYKDREYHEKRIIAMSGVDPYAGGSVVEGTNYAREVEAIKSSTGLTAASITADVAAFWIQNVRKLLCALSIYGDDVDVAVRYDGVTLEYGPQKSIKDRIAPDADIAVREDTTVYRSRSDKMREAAADIQIASMPTMLQRFPNAINKAYETYLAAKGETNLKAWTESPVADQMAAAGVQTPQAMTEGSTAGIQ